MSLKLRYTHNRNNAINSLSHKNNPGPNNEIRVKEFLSCLGNGETIYQIEQEEYLEGELNE